jgi:citrate lyase subunit beta/citryl-CoA lyase
MSDKIRRSWLLVPVSKEERIAQAHQTGADVVVLDLAELVAEGDKPKARERVASAIGAAKAGGAEVFAQVDPELLYADLKACAWPGLSGIIIARMESPRQIAEADALLSQLEAERGILPNTLDIVASLETAQGNHRAYDISTTSQRLWGLTLVHLMSYLMQRLIIVANATGLTPLGAWWRAPDRGLLATPENTYHAARRGRAIGFKGSLCIREDQVGPLNRGFTPAEAEVVAARQLLAAYSTGVAKGMAVIEEADRIIDWGMAAQAQHLIDLATACAVREQAKAAALEQRPVPSP